MTQPLPSCSLCQVEKADETGSHILTAWLIASVYDVKGRKRDNEIIYNLDDPFFRFPYFGRSVSTEKIEENIGRELSDNEIDSQKNIFIEDHVFCRNCEKRLKTIEDAFLEKVHRKLTIDKFENQDTISFEENLITRVFFYSQIWRASIAPNIDFKLPQTLENKLRVILNDTLELSLKETLENFEKLKTDILSLPMIVVKLEKTENSTEMPILFHRKYQKPFSIIINDYLVLLYEKESHLRSVEQSFFGITEMLPENILNYNETEFVFGFFEIEKVNKIIQKLRDAKSEEDHDNLRKLYREMFKRQFGHFPHENYVIKFLKELAINDKKIGVKRTKESVLEAMNKSLR